MDEPEPQVPRLTLAALFLKFLGFGLLAFGGPVAQIAMIRRDLVERERWMSGARFNRLLAVMQALPGPEAHELCVHMGMTARGRLGGLLAGLGFMAPGFLLMLAAAWAYQRLVADSAAWAGPLLGMQIVVLALIVWAVRRIGRHALQDRLLWLVAAFACAASLSGAPFWIPLVAGGLVYAFGGRPWIAAGLAVAAVVLAVLLRGDGAFSTPLIQPTGAPAESLDLFLAGLKGGLLTFGGAYTAIPFLRNDAAAHGWMSDGQFLDGLALSGVLPAPLIIFSTFIGYVAGGPLGALAITAGIFLPAFAFSLIFYERLETVVEMEAIKTVLEGVAAGVVGLIVVTAFQLFSGLMTPLDRAPALLAIVLAAFAANWFWKSKLAPPIILAVGGLAGVVLL